MLPSTSRPSWRSVSLSTSEALCVFSGYNHILVQTVYTMRARVCEWVCVCVCVCVKSTVTYGTEIWKFNKNLKTKTYVAENGFFVEIGEMLKIIKKLGTMLLAKKWILRIQWSRAENGWRKDIYKKIWSGVHLEEEEKGDLETRGCRKWQLEEWIVRKEWRRKIKLKAQKDVKLWT